MKKAYGSSLLEVLTVLSIVSILLAAGGLKLSYSITRAENESSAHHLEKFLLKARAIAKARQQNISICIEENNQCVKSGGKHITGFIDLNQNNKLDAKDQILDQQKIIVNDSVLTMRASFGSKVLRFKANTRNSHSGSILICHPKHEEFNQSLRFNLAGRIYLEQTEKGATASNC